MLLSGSGSRRGAGAAAAALLIAATALLPAGATAVTYEPEPAFCKQQVIRDLFPAPAAMPKLHQPPASGRIGFGPARLRLLTTPRLQVGEVEVGFTLGVEQRHGLSLPWTAATTIVEVSRKGRPIGAPRRTTRKVGWLKPGRGDRFQFEVPDDPAFYRTTILLRGASDQKLGKFSFYTQVRKADPEARLKLNASDYRPESTVFMRVENLGNMTAFYGAAYEVEKLEGDAWVEAPENPHGVVLAIGISALPGGMGPCTRFWVPPTTAPGTYRIAKEVTFVLPYYSGPLAKKLRKHPPKAVLTAEFQVVP
jgi:hypothetical protein